MMISSFFLAGVSVVPAIIITTTILLFLANESTNSSGRSLAFAHAYHQKKTSSKAAFVQTNKHLPLSLSQFSPSSKGRSSSSITSTNYIDKRNASPLTQSGAYRGNHEQDLLFQYPNGSSVTGTRTRINKKKPKVISGNDSSKDNEHSFIDHDEILTSVFSAPSIPNNKRNPKHPSNYSIKIEKDSTINIPKHDTLTFIKSLHIQGKVIGKIQCICQDTYSSNAKEEREEECMTTLLHIGQNGVLLSQNNNDDHDYAVDCISDVFVEGTLIGNISCDRLIMTRNGVLIGNVHAKSISIEEGATISGMMKCGSDVDADVVISDVFKNQSESAAAAVSSYHEDIRGTNWTPSSITTTASPSATSTQTRKTGIHDRQLDDESIEERYTYQAWHGIDNLDKGNSKISIDINKSIESINADDDSEEEEVEMDVDHQKFLRNLFDMFKLDSSDESRSKSDNNNDNDLKIKEFNHHGDKSTDPPSGIDLDLTLASIGINGGEIIKEKNGRVENIMVNSRSVHINGDGINSPFDKEAEESKLSSATVDDEINRTGASEVKMENLAQDQAIRNDDYDLSLDNDNSGISLGDIDHHVTISEIVEHTGDDSQVLLDDIDKQALDEPEDPEVGSNNDDEVMMVENLIEEEEDHAVRSDKADLSQDNIDDTEHRIELKDEDSATVTRIGVNEDHNLDGRRYDDVLQQVTVESSNYAATTSQEEDIPAPTPQAQAVPSSSNDPINITNQNKERNKIKWASREIGNYIDRSKNVVVPIIDGQTNLRRQVSMKNIKSKNGSPYSSSSIMNNRFDQKNQSFNSQNPVGMFDDFGNPLFVSNQSRNNYNDNFSSKSGSSQNINNKIPKATTATQYYSHKSINAKVNAAATTRTPKSLSQSPDNINHKFKDAFGNPLIRGADANELAGYRQIREISAVTREILDAHIRQKKKEAIEKAATRANSRHIKYASYTGTSAGRNKYQDVVIDEEKSKIPSFLR